LTAKFGKFWKVGVVLLGKDKNECVKLTVSSSVFLEGNGEKTYREPIHTANVTSSDPETSGLYREELYSAAVLDTFAHFQ
jgi:hypothetical protein